MKLKNLNIFDLMVLTTLVFVIILPLVTIKAKKNLESERVKLAFKTYETSIFDSAISSEFVFLNTVNKEVKVSGVEKVAENGQNYILITLEGGGKIEDGRDIFNGQRVLIGQKAELHGKFWAQGIITEVKYAN